MYQPLLKAEPHLRDPPQDALSLRSCPLGRVRLPLSSHSRPECLSLSTSDVGQLSVVVYVAFKIFSTIPDLTY